MNGPTFRDRLAIRGLLVPVEQACAEHHATLEEVASRSKVAHVARARHEAMRRLRKCGLSSTAIGNLFDRDHSTVLVALKGTG